LASAFSLFSSKQLSLQPSKLRYRTCSVRLPTCWKPRRTWEIYSAWPTHLESARSGQAGKVQRPRPHRRSRPPESSVSPSTSMSRFIVRSRKTRPKKASQWPKSFARYCGSITGGTRGSRAGDRAPGTRATSRRTSNRFIAPGRREAGSKVKLRHEGRFVLGGILGLPHTFAGILVGHRVGRRRNG
jgi:hypothetical protein